MEEKKIKMHYEVMGDYDWVLYVEYEDWTFENVHCKQTFTQHKQRQEYSPLYQFDKLWKLVAYSRYKAEWLTIEDDLNKWENLLWGTRWKSWKEELIYKPIKSLSIPHIKNIVIERHTNKKEYLTAFTDRLTSVITIK